MKILLTGMTPRQCHTANRLQTVSSIDLVREILLELGHEIDHRPISIGESLAGYDVVMCGLASPLSVAAGYKYIGLDAIARAHREGCKLGLYVNDWRLREIVNNFKTVQRLPTRIVRSFFKGLRGYDWAVENLDQLVPVVDAMVDREWPPLLAPLASWGNHEKAGRFLHTRELHTFDPSAYVKPLLWDTSVKTRVWIDAALVAKGSGDELSQEYTWPVHSFSTARGATRVLESEVLKMYAGARGSVSRCHRAVSGSGWWRGRYVQAAQARCVLVADDVTEVAAIGPSYNVTSAMVEALSDGELDQLADSQRQEYRAIMPPREQVREAVASYLAALT